MDKREFLRSKGFTVGKRGRFSAEMLEALKEFTEDTPATPATPAAVADEPIPPMRNYIKRNDGVTLYTAVLKAGQIVNFDTCPRCKNSIIFCHCVNPGPPKWLESDVASWSTAG